MPSPHVRGATRRVPPKRRRKSRGKWSSFDRWLDRIVTFAVVIAVVVGVVALALSYLLEA
ncbi:hypothetical protein [Halomonas huangheensis]|uniref:Uncharacterized protein n=1 Tax=Halomonas huangheensis TaxID=1178482 RepID=W1N9T9_9GAMM|nr:hypothetical protein [Halomonas huangheensis]ALM53797.1 hypothetical protein AR456_17090 [Halomonas huangheensis]ERL52274.1 hypothetical protein BJB45_09920 [Halomonas huangheensis]